VGRKAAPAFVKRYGNRKLYDPAARRYVTLDDLRERVAAGADLRVEDRRTGEDLTNLTLAQVLLEGLRSRTARIPRPILVRLVRLSAQGEHAPWTRAPEVVLRAGAEAERIASGLFTRGRLTLDEALSLRQEITGAFAELVSDAQAGVEAAFGRLVGGRARAPRKPNGRPRARRLAGRKGGR
jgi:polyhydroxyalkanoate synthesis repressor PhaR